MSVGACLLASCVCQSPSFKGAPGDAWDLRRRTEITPVKDSHTRIKPLALASGHGRYMHNRYCVFHLEPAVALSSFFFAITRYFLMLGVFVGLFGGAKGGAFFLGGSFWRNRAIFSPF